MPETRLARARAELPTDYRFGDGRPLCPCQNPFCDARHEPPRPTPVAWNVIEGEPFETDAR